MPKKTDPKELFERAQDAFTEAEKTFKKAVKDFEKRLQEAFGETKEFRHNLEERMEQGSEAFWSALGLATKAEVADAQRKISALQKRVKELEGSRPASRRAEA